MSFLVLERQDHGAVHHRVRIIGIDVGRPREMLLRLLMMAGFVEQRLPSAILT